MWSGCGVFQGRGRTGTGERAVLLNRYHGTQVWDLLLQRNLIRHSARWQPCACSLTIIPVNTDAAYQLMLKTSERNDPVVGQRIEWHQCLWVVFQPLQQRWRDNRRGIGVNGDSSCADPYQHRFGNCVTASTSTTCLVVFW